jgi:hypothetical protein
VWLVEKRVFRHVLDAGFERVEIPVRVKFEFEVVEGCFVPDTLTKDILYNRVGVEKRYPEVNLSSLDRAIEGMVEEKIMEYLVRCGFVAGKNA